MSHAETEIWNNVANRRELNADDIPGLLLTLANVLDDRLEAVRNEITLTRMFVGRIAGEEQAPA